MFDKEISQKVFKYLSINEDLINAGRYDEIYYGVKDEEKRYVTYIFKGAGLLDDVIDNLGTLSYGMFYDYDIPEKFDLPKKFVIKGQKHILSGAFAGNSTVEEIVFEDDHPDYVSIDGNVYSKDKKTLIQYAPAKKEESFIVPDFVEEIGLAFNENQFLKKVVLSNSVNRICDHAFENCESLEEVILPQEPVNFGNKAFSNCKALKEITIPKNSRGGSNIFENCVSLEKVVIEGNAIFDNATFLNCSKLEDVKLEEGFNVPPRAFENCTSLTEIKLPRNEKNLGYAVFKNCTSLKTISLPRTIEKIDRAFENCTSLENIKLF